MNFVCTKFNIPSSNGSLIITIKLKSKYRIHVAAMLFFLLQKELCKCCIFNEELLPHFSSGACIKKPYIRPHFKC
jgi:hypothetical protein